MTVGVLIPFVWYCKLFSSHVHSLGASLAGLLISKVGLQRIDRLHYAFDKFLLLTESKTSSANHSACTHTEDDRDMEDETMDEYSPSKILRVIMFDIPQNVLMAKELANY